MFTGADGQGPLVEFAHKFVSAEESPMTTDNRSQEPSELPAGNTLPSVGRRRLFQGAAGSAGVLLSVHAKTALGSGVCKSPSAIMSGNTSPRPGSGITCHGGRHSQYWKKRSCLADWPGGCTKPQLSTTDLGYTIVEGTAAPNGHRLLTAADVPGSKQGTMMSTVFTGAPTGLSLWAAMAFSDNTTGAELRRAVSAAYLNTLKFTAAGSRYPITTLQLQQIWDATKTGGTYCPGTIGGCGSSAWTVAQVISYLDGMAIAESPVQLYKPN
jgi:hypothetical protein